MSNKTEIKIPKLYYYSVEGVLDSNGDLRKFSTPSYGLDLNEEFDLDCISSSTALTFFLDNEEYKDESKWPLNFKFYKTLKDSPIELEMNLTFSPCFFSTPKPIVVTKEAEAISTVKPKRARKPKESLQVVEDVIDTEDVEHE